MAFRTTKFAIATKCAQLIEPIAAVAYVLKLLVFAAHLQPKSMCAAKSFDSILHHSDASLERMATLICNELAERMQRDFEQFARRPSVLHIHWNNAASKQLPLPVRAHDAASLLHLILPFFRGGHAPASAFPLFNLTVSVDKMIDTSAQGPSIQSFFKAQASSSSSSSASSSTSMRTDDANSVLGKRAHGEESSPTRETKTGGVGPLDRFMQRAPAPAPLAPHNTSHSTAASRSSAAIVIDDCDEESDDWQCAECAFKCTSTSAAERAEHLDFHVALRLSRPSQARTGAEPAGAKRARDERAKAKPAAKDDMRQRIDRIFGPK